jgi:hypothetical protein
VGTFSCSDFLGTYRCSGGLANFSCSDFFGSLRCSGTSGTISCSDFFGSFRCSGTASPLIPVLAKKFGNIGSDGSSGGSSGGSPGGSSGGTTSTQCSAIPNTPNLSFEWNAAGVLFKFSPSASGPSSNTIYWSYALYNSNTNAWDSWSSWQSISPAVASQYQAQAQAGKSKIAFAVYASNLCGSSNQARESTDQKGIVLVRTVQDSISLKSFDPKSILVGSRFPLKDLVASKLNLKITALVRTPGSCNLDGSDNLQFRSAGECALYVSTITSGNNLGVENAEVNFQILITKVAQEIDLSGIRDSYPLSTVSVKLPQRSSANLLIRYSTSSEDICSVIGNVVTLFKEGGCQITANQDGDAKTLPAAPKYLNILILENPLVQIVCTKGKLSKAVSGINPKCPSGFKVKK